MDEEQDIPYAIDAYKQYKKELEFYPVCLSVVRG